MKKLLTAVLSVLLLAAFAVSGGIAAFAATTLDSPTYSLAIAKGISYSEHTVNIGGTQKVFYGEYKPQTDSEYEFVIHSIRDGSKTTLTNVLDIAKDYEAKTGRKVMMATNGDYFDFGTGVNMESYVNDGIVINKGAYATKHCIGFDNNGKAVTGRLTETEKKVYVVTDKEKKLFEIDKLNAEPAAGEIAVYTNPGTYTVTGAGKYVARTSSTNLGQYPVWGTSNRTKTGTVTNDDAFTISGGQFAVVIKDETAAQYFFDNVVYGVEVDLVETPAGDFAGCTWVLGGYDILVSNGTVNTAPHTDNDGDGYAPRTFIGFKADGTCYLCVVDGRGKGGSKGLTVKQEAQFAKDLGAVESLELDGGGSSTMIIRIDDKLTLRNVPSDGAMRRVSNAIMLVEKQKTSSGGETPVTPPSETPAESVTVTFDTDGGTAVAPQTVEKGGKAICPAPSPSKEGYKFIGWFKVGETTAFDFERTIDENITLKAYWEEEQKTPVAPVPPSGGGSSCGSLSTGDTLIVFPFAAALGLMALCTVHLMRKRSKR